jgi:hydrogenase maturation protein HypF
LDGILLHNRDILNRTDDSVVFIANQKERVIRRSRGYVPSPFRLPYDMSGIVAFGSDLANSFCIGNGNKAILSQYIGDLENYDTSVFFDQTLQKFLKLFKVQPSILVTDLHPDYFSTKLAESYSRRIGTGNDTIIPIVKIQHHHAHVASCMAEHCLDEQVIGVSFDGTGFGMDGRSWGAEFMVCDLLDFKRMTYLEYMALPGGDTATEEPWRMAISYLYKVYGEDWLELRLPLMEKINQEKARSIMSMIDRNLNCPLVSSAGRLFDAVSAMLGLCEYASFHAEAPMRLEALVKPGIKACYPFKIKDTIEVQEVIRGIVDDLETGISLANISTKFHNTLATIILDTIRMISKTTGIHKVVLSGGVFQNKYLLEETENRLISHTFEVYSHQKVPSNDGGIALGQAVIAAKRRELCV